MLGAAGSSWMNGAQTVGWLVWIFTYQTCVAGWGLKAGVGWMDHKLLHDWFGFLSIKPVLQAKGCRLKLDESRTNCWMICLDIFLSNFSCRLRVAGLGGRLKLDEWSTNGWMIGLDFYLSNLCCRLGAAGSSWMNEAQTVGWLVWIHYIRLSL